MITLKTPHIPADVPAAFHEEFKKNYLELTKGTERFFLFAADHKMEHLDADFYGPGIPPEVHNPAHLFAIASQAKIGALATQLGLIARYGQLYPTINYVAKLNSKITLYPYDKQSIPTDPFSKQLWSVSDALLLKKQANIGIRAIGLTLYLGNEHEEEMLAQAAEAVFQAHQNGLVAILWIYLRGKAVKDENDAALLAGAAGVAACLGADFVKI